jgi:hypothetical protein
MKTIIFIALLAIPVFSIGQSAATISKNKVKIDGKSYKIKGKKSVTYTKDKYDNWNLTGQITTSDNKSVAFNFRTDAKSMPSGTYPLTPNIKKIEAGKVAFSLNIMDTKSMLGVLGMKQYSSLENGKATIKNENGIYSIEVSGVDAISLKKDILKLDANITFDPNDDGSKKREPKLSTSSMTMSKAWTAQSENFFRFIDELNSDIEDYNESKSSSVKKSIKSNLDDAIEANDEVIAILSRTKDGSLTDADVKNYTSLANKQKSDLQNFKDKMKNDDWDIAMKAFLNAFNR